MNKSPRNLFKRRPNMPENTRRNDMIILIPARMAASRLNFKYNIAGKPLIEHVWAGVVAADIALLLWHDHHDIRSLQPAAALL